MESFLRMAHIFFFPSMRMNSLKENIHTVVLLSEEKQVLSIPLILVCHTHAALILSGSVGGQSG